MPKAGRRGFLEEEVVGQARILDNRTYVHYVSEQETTSFYQDRTTCIRNHVGMLYDVPISPPAAENITIVQVASAAEAGLETVR
jgi:hypothetical protein